MADKKRTSELLLKAKSDNKGFVDLRLESAKTRGEMDYLVQTTKATGIAIAQTGKTIRDAFNSKATQALAGLNLETEKGAKAYDKLADSIRKVANEKEKLASGKQQSAADIADERFGDISRQVGVIGDVESSLRATGATGLLPDLLGAAEAFPRLKVGIQGLPAQVDAAAEALGTTRAGFIGGVGLAGVALIGFQVIANQFAADMDRIQRVNKEGLAGAQEYYQIISSGSQSTIEGAIAQIEAQKKASEATIASFQNILKLTDEATAAQSTDLEEGAEQRLADALQQIGIAADDFDAGLMRAEIERLQKETDEGATHLGGYQKALADLNAEAERNALELAQAQSAIAQNQTRISAQLEASNLAISGTEKQVQDRIDALGREKAVLTENLPLLERQVAAATEGSEAQKVLQAQVDQTRLRLSELDTTMLTLAGDTLATAKANDVAAESERKRADSVKLVEKYNADVIKIDEAAAQREIDIATKLADAQISIARKAVEDAENVLKQLEQKRNELALGLQRDLDADTRKANFDALTQQITFQRDEVAETKKHLADLERIRRQSQESEFELGLSRDFAGLARQRRATANQIAESNTQFNQDRQARLDAFKAKLEDDRNQFIFERQERIIQFQQAITDLRAQGARELKVVNDNRVRAIRLAQEAANKELQLSQQKHRTEITLRDQAIRAELQLIQQGESAKLQIYQNTLRQIQLLSGGSVNSGGGGGSTGRAFGGPLRAGQRSLVNEPGISSGRETFANSRGSIAFPGYGMFTPSSAGQVNANRGGNITLNMPINIQTGGSAAQVQAIVPAIRREASALLNEYHEKMYGKT